MKQYNLGDCFRIKHGYAFKGEYFTDSGHYIVLTPGNFYEEGGFRLKPGKEKYYVGEIPIGYILNGGDLIVAMTEQAEGLLGSPALIPESHKYLHNQRLGLLYDLDERKFDKRFLYYLFNHQAVRGQIRATANGAKVRHTSPSRIYDVVVSVPEVPMQRRIASILSAYDDLIENNTRRIAILEEMARALYREWFVHFRFPGHEHVPLASSPLGPIPEGWDVLQVGQIAGFTRGRSYKSSELVEEGGIPFINLKCIDRDGGFRKEGLKRYQGSFKPEQVVSEGDIVMAVTDMTQERRIVAQSGRVPTLDKSEGVISMDMIKINPKTGVDREFLYATLRWSKFPNEVKHHANGANVLHLNPRHVLAYCLTVPPHETMTEYGQIISAKFQFIDVLLQKNANLRTTRDMLLPKLISGEVDVSAVSEEPIAEAAD